MIRQALRTVVAGGSLARSEASELVAAVMRGEGSEIEIAGLLAALRTRGETLDEVVGAALAMRSLALPLPDAPAEAVDIVGTGGDGAGTFNISSVASFVVAGAGGTVAKHGNRAATSRCGSAEVFAALGVNLDVDPARMAEAVRQIGIGFLFARQCHPAMARVAPIRTALGIPTIFNRLGPLTNPMRVRRHMVGVAQAALVEPTLDALVELGAERAWVVHGEDGLDEISTCAPTQVVVWNGHGKERHVLETGAFVPTARSEDLLGGDVEENAAIARSVLAGDRGPKRDIVVVNAAAALVVAGRVRDLAQGVALAAESIDSGHASAALERLCAFTNGRSAVS
jgi:anthranilate phosphoribosyltransferase